MNTDQTSAAIGSLLDAAVQAAEVLSARNHHPLEYAHIERALVMELELEFTTDLLGLNLGKDEIVKTLERFNFNRLFPKLLDVIHMEESIIPDGTRRKLTEVTVRSRGQVWRIHQNDDDPFPSNPHAHNLESGLKLHLGTGELYDGTRNTGEKVSLKNLKSIRSRLSKHTLPQCIR
jgi:hypothetical protein